MPAVFYKAEHVFDPYTYARFFFILGFLRFGQGFVSVSFLLYFAYYFFVLYIFFGSIPLMYFSMFV